MGFNSGFKGLIMLYIVLSWGAYVPLFTSLLGLGYCAGDKIKKNEMGRACSAYGGGERFVQGFGG